MVQEFTFGIEEEYFLSDARRRDTARNGTRGFIEAAQDAFPDEVHPELLESQVEIATRPLSTCQEARDTLQRLRGGLSRLAREHDLLLTAVGTHPIAAWTRQRATPQRRYGKVMHDLQMVGSRHVVSGLHVHVALGELDDRIDVMNRILPFLPLLLALSTSSPFWQGQRTGLMSYRSAAAQELPRSGLPDLFGSAAEYQRYVDTLVEARAIENSSFLWWVIRPSLKHPTLELRVADVCTRAEDALAIAALYRCLVRHLARSPGVNRGLDGASRAIVLENHWRAQRYGIHGSFVDEATRSAKPVAAVLDETLALVAEDAAAMGCDASLAVARDILHRGTSADRQLALFTDATGRGATPRDALCEVMDWIGAETAGGSARH
ncbi:carboxylate-amine ligase [Salinarimonas soli]|uniref:Putative glutamate--cysteine ligase 2 n=1 Tax=Salinarimonas soli TaxID=1638099 RepID=A0A5B2VT43_9HYPH|nr:carboxylate-amine ligase [Salinarimonas soli]KAA2242175.1 carboxylate-amine ligase [Salinarimonas soli]